MADNSKWKPFPTARPYNGWTVESIDNLYPEAMCVWDRDKHPIDEIGSFCIYRLGIRGNGFPVSVAQPVSNPARNEQYSANQRWLESFIDLVEVASAVIYALPNGYSGPGYVKWIYEYRPDLECWQFKGPPGRNGQPRTSIMVSFG